MLGFLYAKTEGEMCNFRRGAGGDYARVFIGAGGD